jgi:hypothetical protein
VDLLTNFTDEQLKFIGSIVIAYNACEHVLHNIAGYFVGPPADPRIETTFKKADHLIDLVLVASRGIEVLTKAGLQKEIIATLKGNGFTSVKLYRDAIVHCMPHNALVGIGRLTKRGGTRFDVLLTAPALEWLATTLLTLHQEMGCLSTVIRVADELSRSIIPAKRKDELANEFSWAISRYRNAQRERSDLKQPPRFPAAKDIPRP